MIRLLPVLLASALVLSSCSRSTSTNVRGKVHFENKPVVGAEVRLSTPNSEATARTNYDGSYELSLQHPSRETLELKVIWPGYVHDKIDFPAYASPEKQIDIELKKVFTPSR